jgi:hypothetical protein
MWIDTAAKGTMDCDVRMVCSSCDQHEIVVENLPNAEENLLSIPMETFSVFSKAGPIEGV